MPINKDAVGKQWPPVAYEVGLEKIREYARAVGEENPVHLARKFRSLAGFSEDEITELVDTAAEAYAEAQAMQAAAAQPA